MKTNKVILCVIILIFLVAQSSITVSAAPYSAPTITLSGNTITWNAVDVQYGVSAPTAYHIYCNGSDGSSASYVVVAGQSMSWTIDTRYLDYDVTYSFYVKATAANTIWGPASNTVQFIFHSYYQDWKTDNSSHWYECRGCGYKNHFAAHSFDNSCDTNCNICYYYRSTNHTPNSDDGDCTTPIRCKGCNAVTTSGKAYHSFTDNCDTTCNNKGCTHIRTVSHDYTKLEKNTTEHWYVCTQCGAEQPNSRSTHSGGNSNCQVKANCVTCGQTYGDFGDHNYDTSQYGYQDTTGHAHKCLFCNAHDILAPHSPNISAATEEVAKYCTVNGCGYIIQQKLDHVHQESSIWEYDSTYHWHDCIANDNQIYNKGAHTYDNACDTTCNGGCGYVRTITHNYAKVERNASEHWCVCSVCDAEKPNSRISHSGGRATCTALAICSTCQQEYGEFAQHPFGTSWEYKDVNGHAHICTATNCYANSEIIPHTPNISAPTEKQAQVCTVCGYQIAAQLNHTHSAETEWSSNVTHHWHACKGCDIHLNEAEHNYVDNCDMICDCGYARTAPHSYTKLQKNATEHWYVCSACNIEKPNSRATHSGGAATCTALAFCTTCQQEYGVFAQHSYGTTWEYKVANGHAHMCTATNCAAYGEIIPHTPNITAPTEQQAQVCTACGYQIAAPLNHTHSPTTDWSSNATHHWQACGNCDGHLHEEKHEFENDCDTACVCGYVRSVTHDLTDEWQKNETHHWKVCTCCGSKLDAMSHEFGEKSACNVCGYVIGSDLGSEETKEPTLSTDITNPTDKTNPKDGSSLWWSIIIVAFIAVGCVVTVIVIKKRK